MLFKDSIKLKEYAEFTEINFASIKPTLRNVENVNLIPIIGTELYNALDTAYNGASDETTLGDADKSLLDKCRQVIAPYLIYNYTPKADIMLSDSGARRAETATLKTAFGYQTVNFREQKLAEAETAEELLLCFLETNKADYNAWTTSTAFKNYRSLFIKSGAQFNECFTSQTPYRNYHAIRTKMVDVEQNVLRDALGDDLFNYLKTKDADATYTFSDKEMQLLFKIKRAVAYLAVSFAVPYLSVRIDTNGITVVSNNSSGRIKDFEIRQDATEKAKSSIISNAAATGREWLNNAIKFLNDNYSDFSQWPAPADIQNCDTSSGNASLTGTFAFV